MDNPELDDLQKAYREAVDQWVAAIRAEEALASGDHSMVAMEHWEQAGFERKDAGEKALKARQAYEDGLRRILFGF